MTKHENVLEQPAEVTSDPLELLLVERAAELARVEAEAARIKALQRERINARRRELYHQRRLAQCDCTPPGRQSVWRSNF